MAESSSNPRYVPSPSHSDTDNGRPASPGRSPDRAVLNERLASPIPSSSAHRRGNSFNDGNNNSAHRNENNEQTPLEGASDAGLSGFPGASALASALHATLGRMSSRQSLTGPETGSLQRSGSYFDIDPNNGGSAAHQPRSRLMSGTQSPAPYEDFDVVRKHLVGPSSTTPAAVDGTPSRAMSPGVPTESAPAESESGQGVFDDDFSSLRLQGGDVHREIYRRAEAEENAKNGRPQRSQSFSMPRAEGTEADMDYDSIREPQGFRRDYIIRNTAGPAAKSQLDGSNGAPLTPIGGQPNFLTRNFYEFLSLYGHFAGESAEDDTDDDEASTRSHGGDDDDPENPRGRASERRPLLPRRPTKRQWTRNNAPKKGATGTIFILLKGFIGTGVLFLPRAFLNGGLVFSTVTLLIIAFISYYCFILLTTSRVALKGSYAEMGNMIHGPWLRFLINTSLVLSQMGFSSAYIVFISENLRAFVYSVSNQKVDIDIKFMIMLQLVVFLPLSLYRNLNNIAYIVYIADIFIVLGLVYLYYYGIATIIGQHGLSDVVFFNNYTWPLFIGTAVFTFEGIGLLIPIQDGMKDPKQLPRVLWIVMLIIATIFISMGAVSYSAYGSKTQTVIILNMPQDSKFVQGVQFLYSFAILLSTPMQIFPAITIMEKGIFTKSGKYSKRVKWRKNAFRFLVVMVGALVAWLGAGDLDKFVSLVGCFACVPLVYIYPPLIHRKAVANSRASRILDVIIICFGFILMVYTTILTIGSWIHG